MRTVIAKRSKDVVQKLLSDKDKQSKENFASITNNQEWKQALEDFEVGAYLSSITSFKAIPDGATAKTCYNIAQNYRTLSRFESSIFYYSLALQLDPYLAIAYFSRGNCYFSAGDSFQAALDFTTVLDVFFFFSSFLCSFSYFLCLVDITSKYLY